MLQKKDGLRFDKSKSKIQIQSIQLFGHQISSGEVRPDWERLQPLKEMPPTATSS